MLDLSTVDLGRLAEQDGAQLRGSPERERFGPCPKCGGTDRFHVRRHNGKDWFFCRECHIKRADAVEYLQWARNMTCRQAVEYLQIRDNGARPTPKPVTPVTARKVAIPDALPLPPGAEWQASAREYVADCKRALWQNIPALRYLLDRGLTGATIAHYSLGWSERTDAKAGHWRGWTIPVRFGGALWAVNTRRSLTGTVPVASGTPGAPKYQQVTGSSRSAPFNGDALADKPSTVLVVEGEFDAMLCGQYAPNGMAVITLGSASMRPTWALDYLTRGARVLLCFDADKAGEDAASQFAKFGARVHLPALSALPSAKDASDYHAAGGDLSAWLRSL